MFRKQLSELKSEKRYLEKSNMHLENILEATKAHKNLEVSQLNKLHMETIKVTFGSVIPVNQRGKGGSCTWNV